MLATAPGKLIVTGEYAVLDGTPALVLAMNRRVVASRRAGPRGSSPFLLALADELATRFGADHPAARTALEIAVDSTAFYQGTTKLGLGSSAAVTVAATALALGAPLDRARVLEIASVAHANAQGEKGARGSGADIASAVHGGAIAFTRPSGVERLAWPSGVTLLPFFTGVAADTATLVARVQAAREREQASVGAALSAIDRASRAAIQACALRDADLGSRALLAALQLAGVATDQLAAATGVDLVPTCVAAARGALSRLGGTAKTTGAGGGDIGIAVIPATEDATIARRYLIETGCQPLPLSVDATGVDLQADAQ